MKIFFDTNIWIAFIVTPRSCRVIIKHAWAKHKVLISKGVMNEMHKVLATKFRYPNQDIDEALSFIIRKSYLVEEAPLTVSVCRDQKDNHILAAASGGEADCLVTGDNDLLVLGIFDGIPILRPHEFWNFENQFGSQLAETRAKYAVKKKPSKTLVHAK